MPRRGSGLTRIFERARLLAGCVVVGCGLGSPICALGMLTKCFHSTDSVRVNRPSQVMCER
jgi:hypothetical protein